MPGGKPQISPTADLKAHLEALLLRHARGLDARSSPAAFEQSMKRFREEKRFREDMRRLIAKFGQAAVDAALDGMPKEPWPSVSLH